MRVLVFAPAFAPAVNAGGPARSLTNLVEEASSRYEVTVITGDRDLGSSEPYPGLSGRRIKRGAATVYYINPSSRAHWVMVLTEIRRESFDLILLNSIWHQTLSALPAALGVIGAIRGPFVVMPRGELESGALALKSRKKRLGRPVARALYRRAASAVGTTSDSEAEVAAQWFPKVPLLRTSNSPDAIDFGQPEAASASLRVLTVGRVHPTKGLLPLLQGLASSAGMIQVSSVGPLQDPDYWSQCQGAARRLPANVRFNHLGATTRNQLPPLLWNSDCMVLLTAGENYGHAIAEALQAGCPVITTPTTPWTEVIRAGGGEIVENRDDPAELAWVLDRWASKTPEELGASRLAARSAFEDFTAQAGPNIIDLALEVLKHKP